MSTVVRSFVSFVCITVFSFYSLGASKTKTKISIVEVIGEVSKLLNSPQTNFKELQDKLDAIFVQMENLDPLDLDLEEVRKNTNSIVRTTDRFSRDLVQKIPEWQQQGVWTQQSETTVRNITRALRYFGDAVGEYSMSLGGPQSKPLAFRTMTGGEPFVVTHDEKFFNPYADIKPGDVILMRGSSEVSAAIARVADVNTQFSHLAIVTQDPETRRLYLQEALIERGLITSPIEDFIDHKVGRAVIYRHEDPVRAQRASEAAWKRSHDGRTYIYDFSMKYKVSPEELTLSQEAFCTLAIRDAFYYSGGEGKIPYELPKNPSKINPKNREFLRMIGVANSTRDVFAPSDIELDPDFTKVAEYRDFSRTPTQRIYDVIFDKIYEWMDEGGHFTKNKILKLIATAGHNASKNEAVKQLLWKVGVPVAPHVKPDVLRAVFSIGVIRFLLQRELQPKINAYFQMHGLVPTPKMLATWLDEVREREKNWAFKFLELRAKSKGNMCLKFYNP